MARPDLRGRHWVPEQVDWAGGEEVLSPQSVPSPEVPWQAVIDAQPEVVVLMPCGMPIDRTLGELETVTSRAGWDELLAVPDGRVFVVDASSFFNRPGPRVVRGAEILATLIHPDVVGPRCPAKHAACKVDVSTSRRDGPDVINSRLRRSR